jgi:hypothetical protein
MVFSIISVTTDAILAAARNHPEKIGSHGQSNWKNNRVGRKKIGSVGNRNYGYFLGLKMVHILCRYIAIVWVSVCVFAYTFIPNGFQDNTVRIWRKEEDGEMECIGVGLGHTHLVSCVAWPRYQDLFLLDHWLLLFLYNVILACARVN